MRQSALKKCPLLRNVYLLLCIREFLIESNHVNVRNMGRLFVKAQTLFNTREHILVKNPANVKNVGRTLVTDKLTVWNVGRPLLCMDNLLDIRVFYW
uniref:Uncharacterized protein n=1 Tax=Ursus americanus TaxID=9643 RepID=A0A452QXM6_URSAM